MILVGLTLNTLVNWHTGKSFGDDGYTPAFEFIQEIDSCFDMVFVLDDSGYGVEIFVPQDIEAPPALLAMCQQYAFKADDFGHPPVPAKTQATIYVKAQALENAKYVQGLDEGERDLLALSPETDPRQREGYYLCMESMRLEVLPVHAQVAVVLSPNDIDTYSRHVTFPPELRGVVFSGAPRLPDNYAAILGYWSPLQITNQHDGAQHCQNLLNEYAVPEIDGHPQDALLSNAVVVCMQNMLALIAGMDPSQCIEIHIPVDAEMLGMDREKFDSDYAYGTSTSPTCERIYLKVQDVLDSTNPDFIAIAVLHTENFDCNLNI
jgi:hypothetical protein